MTEHTTPPAYVDEIALDVARSVAQLDPRNMIGGYDQYKARIQLLVLAALQRAIDNHDRDQRNLIAAHEINEARLNKQLDTARRDYDVMNRIREGLEQERDALEAHVHAIQEAAESGRWDEDRLCAVLDVLDRSPDTSLAQRDAAQWQMAADHLARRIRMECDTVEQAVSIVEAVRTEKRRKAEGGAS